MPCQRKERRFMSATLKDGYRPRCARGMYKAYQKRRWGPQAVGNPGSGRLSFHATARNLPSKEAWIHDDLDERIIANALNHRRARHTAPGGGLSVYPAFAKRKAGHGNDRVWKAWKAMKPASHPSHTLWKSLRDSHIATASTTGYMSSRAP